MGIIIGKIELNSEKKIMRELKKKIKGINYTTAGKIIRMAGYLEGIKGTGLTKTKEREISEIVGTYKGLIDYNYGVVAEELEKIRRSNDVYAYVRYCKGYPKKGRTKSNGQTARSRVKKKKENKKELMMLTKKPQNRKERKLYNKLKKLQDKFASTQKKGKGKGKKSKGKTK